MVKIIVVTLLFASALLLTVRAVKITERNECAKWQQQAKEYKNFYLTNWQRAQCEAVNK